MKLSHIKGETKDYVPLSSLEKGDAVEVVSEGRFREIQDKDGKMKKIFELGVSVNKGKATWVSPNGTTMSGLKETLGSSDTQDWVGQVLTVDKIKQIVFGKEQEITVLRGRGKILKQKKIAE